MTITPLDLQQAVKQQAEAEGYQEGPQPDMDFTIEELQAQLADKIARLDEERRINADQFAKKQSDLAILAEAERLEQAKTTLAIQERARQEELATKEAEEERVRTANRERMGLEAQQNKAAEAARLYREKLYWLEQQISNAKFTEEQHKKTLENQSASLGQTVVQKGVEINVEHPIAPDNNGEAVLGTGGDTPADGTMSSHLRHILRQANRV